MSIPEYSEEAKSAASDAKDPPEIDSSLPARAGRRWFLQFILCALAFCACILLTVTPLMRMPDTFIRLRIAPGAFLGKASLWLPVNIGAAYQPSSPSIEFFGIITLAFLCYCLAAWLVSRQPEKQGQSVLRACIWSGLILAGAIYIVTPALLSHDMFAYAGYSRLLAAYHVNPYFSTMSAFPGDPIAHFDQWASANAAYGPIWMLVCGLIGLLAGSSPLAYVIAFRVFALAMHVLNTWLVGRALGTMGRAPRTRTLGMLFYGWNPLVLLECCLNGHNDVFMITFVLLGILLAAQAEKHGLLLRPRGYLPPIAALALAALVKYTILPVLVLYLLFLACKALRAVADRPLTWRQALAHWRAVAPLLCWSCLVALLVALAFYVPFWPGHSPREIALSFGNNPVAGFAENSYMRSVINWLNFHPEQQHNILFLFFSWRQPWNAIDLLALLLCFILGARQLRSTPTVGAFGTLALATMCIVLLLTPWFFTWYVTWIVGLMAVCLPARQNRNTWAFFALALTFSYSALTLYLFNYNLLGSRGYLVSLFDTIPPIAAFFLCWLKYSYPASQKAISA